MKSTRKNRSYGLMVLAATAVLLAADQIIKYFVVQNLKPIGAFPLIDGLLELVYVENTGAAFGLFKNAIWIVVLISIIAFIAIIILLFKYKNHTFFSYATSALLLSGGLGNLIDRICYGYVVDYIHVMFFDYIFNLADCCITVGAVLFIIHYLIYAGKEKRPSQTADAPEISEEQNK